MTVNFYIEKEPGIFVSSTTDDIGYGISQDNMIVLKNPQFNYKKDTKLVGYFFPKTIVSIVSTLFEKK